MATIDSNLYPPIFKQSYVPAFIYNQKCKIYFSISIYNNILELHPTKPVQIIVQNQKTNQYVLNESKYPSGIMLTTLQIDNTRFGQDKYYIEISSSDIKNGFSLNEYYKVQIRLTGSKASVPPANNTGIDAWLSENIKYFSQWSTVALIYGISKPTITLTGFKTDVRRQFTTSDVSITGKITFQNENDKEKVRSYKILLYEKNSDILLEDSGNIYVDNYQIDNEINYTLKYNLQEEITYIIKVNIETINLYTLDEPETYRFIISGEASEGLDMDINYESNNDSGFIKIILGNKYTVNDDNKKYTLSNNNLLLTGKSLYLALTPQDQEDSGTYVPVEIEIQEEEPKEPEVKKDKTLGSFKSAVYIPNDQDQDEDDDDQTLVLYNQSNLQYDISKGTKFVFARSSSRDNFKMWQNVDEVIIQQENVLNVTWFDYTVEPGVWYKYKITRINSAGLHTGFVKIEEPIMIVPEDIFLQANGQQLRIRFDPQIDSIKRNFSESLTETIGSKYPYIRRNGNVNYRSFGLSGTIVSFMNVKDNLLQASKTDIYQESKELYNNYNQQHNVSIYRDYIYERQFRNKVIDFLCDNNVKLYRSLTEGNILIKLMDITLTPNQTLGRLIYTFSCTAYQIGDCNMKNYQNYKIVKGKYKYTV